ncbi:hypothetical protein L1267_20570 [Pseudoalteromonas sp. OFAV1]|uniref:hypothetical protein n=1 Tax=Pseudoalteromonas sp. OFAV1 TaxID=2908892 RepID=UPI001F3AF3A4|nr:hypothetical protein [Pseudoalteromonas sp. OFAV1]MCF2902767.1 hypothetical protein [Pseudoalteromonas sp. OFAV1]
MKSIYYFDCDKQSPQAILMGMKFAAMKSRKNQSEVIVFVPQLEQVNGGIFTKALGRETARAFLNKRALRVGGTLFRLVSDRTFSNTYSNDVILAVWVSKTMRKKLEDSICKELVVVPLRREENLDWAMAQSAQIMSIVAE